MSCTGVIEDEQHALFDCPVYADLREKFRDLIQEHCRTLVQLFSYYQDYTKLAKFLTLCRERRVQMVERNAFVLWPVWPPKDYKM
jgi:hypothetical protein